MKTFRILSLNISKEKGEKKIPVNSIDLKNDHGIIGDAHAGNWHRQVSLLANEDIDTMRNKGVELNFGDFAENITTLGIPLSEIPVGTQITIGDCILEITQIGKECHSGCAISRQVGTCVMPTKGIFAKVIKEGRITCENTGTYII